MELLDWVTMTSAVRTLIDRTSVHQGVSSRAAEPRRRTDGYRPVRTGCVASADDSLMMIMRNPCNNAPQLTTSDADSARWLVKRPYRRRRARYCMPRADRCLAQFRTTSGCSRSSRGRAGLAAGRRPRRCYPRRQPALLHRLSRGRGHRRDTDSGDAIRLQFNPPIKLEPHQTSVGIVCLPTITRLGDAAEFLDVVTVFVRHRHEERADPMGIHDVVELTVWGDRDDLIRATVVGSGVNIRTRLSE